MFISDLHHDLKPHHGIDQSRAFYWLLDIVDIIVTDRTTEYGLRTRASELKEWACKELLLCLWMNKVPNS